VGLEIGGYNEHPDWPKMGPSLLIATSLILAIRTAKWPTQWHETASDTELEKEIEYARRLAGRVLSTLIANHEAIFPKKPWYQPDGEDAPK
jgi:hypothetical protein